jgi:hypothetical protein
MSEIKYFYHNCRKPMHNTAKCWGNKKNVNPVDEEQTQQQQEQQQEADPDFEDVVHSFYISTQSKN